MWKYILLYESLMVRKVTFTAAFCASNSNRTHGPILEVIMRILFWPSFIIIKVWFNTFDHFWVCSCGEIYHATTAKKLLGPILINTDWENNGNGWPESHEGMLNVHSQLEHHWLTHFRSAWCWTISHSNGEPMLPAPQNNSKTFLDAYLVARISSKFILFPLDRKDIFHHSSWISFKTFH